VVFAGPNGAGKTTLFNDMLRGDIPYINADEIAHELDAVSGAIDTLRAGRLAVERRNALVSQRKRLSIETTLAGNSALTFMRLAKEAGFQISLAFVGIDSAELSRARIDDRVAEGGHDVPQDAVVRRHPASLKNLARAASVADSVLVFDNSGLERRLLLQIENGVVSIIEDQSPAWLNDAMPAYLHHAAP
jgi:predicted ABC-type ATPase